MSRVRLLIADDHRLFAESLMVSLSQDDRMDVVGIAENGHEALSLAEELQPDVVLMDVDMPLMSGVEALGELRRRLPDARVIFLTGSEGSASLAGARDAGADAFLLKTVPTTDLLDVILIAAAFARPATAQSA